MTLAENLKLAVQRLQSAGIAEPELDVRLLCEAATGFDRTQQLIRRDDPWDDHSLTVFQHLIDRRAAREPVARILGQRDFWGMTFYLSPATLEPRPDSETLIEAALKARPDRAAIKTILDLGTGTGCLLAALLSEYQEATGLAVDRSPEAAATAQANFVRLGFGPRAQAIVGDWAQGVTGPFDIIISNPPYIGEDELLAPEVRQHDPAAALFAGADGLSDYRRLIPQLSPLLAPGGIAILEVGLGQSSLVSQLAKAQNMRVLSIESDLNDIPRAVILRL